MFLDDAVGPPNQTLWPPKQVLGITSKLSQAGDRNESTKAHISSPGTYWVQHEEVHSLPRGQSHQGGASVECIASSHNVATWLQGILFRRLFLWGLQKREGETLLSLERALCQRRHHRLDGHESDQALGAGDGQGRLVCCSPWGCKESDTTERLNWTELHIRSTWTMEGSAVPRFPSCGKGSRRKWAAMLLTGSSWAIAKSILGLLHFLNVVVSILPRTAGQGAKITASLKNHKPCSLMIIMTKVIELWFCAISHFTYTSALRDRYIYGLHHPDEKLRAWVIR